METNNPKNLKLHLLTGCTLIHTFSHIHTKSSKTKDLNQNDSK